MRRQKPVPETGISLLPLTFQRIPLALFRCHWRSPDAARMAILLLSAFSLAMAHVPALAQQNATVRVGHFPNVTHVQALVARNFRAAGPELVRASGSGRA